MSIVLVEPAYNSSWLVEMFYPLFSQSREWLAIRKEKLVFKRHISLFSDGLEIPRTKRIPFLIFLTLGVGGSVAESSV